MWKAPPNEEDTSQRRRLQLTFDVLAEAHRGGDRLALVAALLLQDVVLAGHVLQAQLFPPLLLLVSGGQLLGEGEHGEDDQQHGQRAQQEAAPPAGGQEGVLRSRR